MDETHSQRQGESADGLLLVTVDRCPAWMLPPYGGTWVAMPACTRLSARGLTFDRVFATTAAPGRTATQLAAASLAAARERGWTMSLISDDPMAAEFVPLNPGDQVLCVPAEAASRPARESTETAIERLFQQAVEAVSVGGHRMVWCHVTSLGVLWDVPLADRESYRDPEDPPLPETAVIPDLVLDRRTDPDLVTGHRHVFAAQLTLLDGAVAGLLAAVASRADRWVIGLAGVRGMPLGLHGRLAATEDIPPYSEVSQLPAIIVDAGGRLAAQRCSELLTPEDVGEVIAASLRGPHAEPCADTAALWQSAARVTKRDRLLLDSPAGGAVVTDHWLALRAGDGAEVRLFCKPDDFFELNDVSDRCREVADAFAALLSRMAVGDAAAVGEQPLPEVITARQT
jgi:hypothetical protein